jgi:hypothetical protein
MSRSVPQGARTEAQQRIQTISELTAYLGHAEAAMATDDAEWYRTLIRALAQISDVAKDAEIEMTAMASDSKALTVTEIAKAAQITRAAVYGRTKRR